MELKPAITKPGFDEAGGGQYHRARQFDPEKCTSTPKTIDITDGVKAVVCRAGGEATSVQSYLFDRDKFSPKEAKDWLEKHGKKALSIEFEDGDQIRVILVKMKKFEIEEAKVEKYFTYDKTKLEVFVPFQKIDEERRRVWAYLTTGDLDYDGQRVDMAAVARALPEYLEWGNVREMHQSRVAGVIQPENAKIDEVGLLGGIDVLRDDTWDLVKGGGYKGVSIGLSDVQIKKSDDTPNGLLTDGGPDGKPFKIIEVSLVDRPANPKCKIVAVKIAGDGKLETDGIKPIEKLALDGEGIVPPEKTGTGVSGTSPAPAAKKTLATFAANWMAGEMMDDLPKMVDTLFSTLGNIIYNPEATAEEKSAAMRQSVDEFSSKCQEYMTGEKLAKALQEADKWACWAYSFENGEKFASYKLGKLEVLKAKELAEKVKAAADGAEKISPCVYFWPNVNDESAKAEFLNDPALWYLKALGENTTPILVPVEKRPQIIGEYLKQENVQAWLKWLKKEHKNTPTENQKILTQIEALKTEFTDKLKEATSTIEKLQGDKVNLEERLKKVEETPIPAKTVSNPDLLNAQGGAFGNMGLKETQEILLSMAKSPDPKMQAIASEIGRKLATKMLGGN